MTIETRINAVEKSILDIQQAVSTKRLEEAARKAEVATKNVEALRQEIERNRTVEGKLAKQVADLETRYAEFVRFRESTTQELQLLRLAGAAGPRGS